MTWKHSHRNHKQIQNAALHSRHSPSFRKVIVVEKAARLYHIIATQQTAPSCMCKNKVIGDLKNEWTPHCVPSQQKTILWTIRLTWLSIRLKFLTSTRPQHRPTTAAKEKTSQF